MKMGGENTGQVVVVNEEQNKFAIIDYDVIVGKMDECVVMGDTMRQYLEKLIDDLGLEWHDLSDLNVMTKKEK